MALLALDTAFRSAEKNARYRRCLIQDDLGILQRKLRWKLFVARSITLHPSGKRFGSSKSRICAEMQADDIERLKPWKEHKRRVVNGWVIAHVSCPAVAAPFIIVADVFFFSKHQSCSNKVVKRNDPPINAQPIAEPSVLHRSTTARKTNSTIGMVNAAINNRACHRRMNRLYACCAGSMVLSFVWIWTRTVSNIPCAGRLMCAHRRDWMDFEIELRCLCRLERHGLFGDLLRSNCWYRMEFKEASSHTNHLDHQHSPC